MPPVDLLLAPFLLSCLLQVFGSARCACFSQVTGYLDDVICDVETIDAFNNEQLFPKLKALLESDYFRFYKVNLNRPCPFWSPSSHCGLSDCAVHPCPDSDLPESIRPAHRQSPAEQAEEAEEECERAERLGAVDSSLSEQTIEALQDWSQHDERDKPFCVADDQDSPEAQYVDLLLNPERYTGYRGAEAQQVWTSIYEENCFKPRSIRRPLNPSSTGSDARIFYTWLEGQCVEKRSFYRLLSGLHASISIHLSARYLLHDSWFQKRWGHNVTEFRRRFDDGVTRGEGAPRLRNLYFLFLTELRALAKALPYFTQPQLQLYTGRKQQDHALKKQLIHILQLARSFPLHFDETSLFAGDDKEAAKMKEDIRLSFLNISRIMDCVGCFKCRLWGKLQTQGLGTALKILFSESPMEPPAPAGIRPPSLQLNRQEVVALLNAFGRISTSIRELQTFRELLAEEH